MKDIDPDYYGYQDRRPRKQQRVGPDEEDIYCLGTKIASDVLAKQSKQLKDDPMEQLRPRSTTKNCCITNGQLGTLPHK